MSGRKTKHLVSPSQVAGLAGVALSTVSNWRVRSSSFPAPAGGSESRPLFDLREIRAWMAGTGKEVKTPERQAAAMNLLALLRSIAPPSDHLGLLLPLLCLVFAEQSAAEIADPKDMTSDHLRVHIEEAALRLLTVNGIVGGAAERSLKSFSENDATLLEVWRLVWDQDLEALEEELLNSARKSARKTNYLGDSRDLAELLVRLVGLGSGSMADLACGFGEVLAVAGAASKSMRLTGRDIDPEALEVTACRMFLRGRSADLGVEDALDNLGPAATFDRVVISPPLGTRYGSGRDYPATTFPFGVPKDGLFDLGWPQIAIERLHTNGTAAVVVPARALLEAGRTREIRQRLLSFGTIEAVVGLPQGTHFGTNLASAILVLSKPGQSRRKDEVFMSEVILDRRGGLQGIDRVVTDFDRWLTGSFEPNTYSVGVPVVSLLAPDASLSPAYWLAMEQPMDVGGILEEYDLAVKKARAALAAVAGQRSEAARLFEAEAHPPANIMALGVVVHRGAPVPGAVLGAAVDDDVPVLTADGVDGLAQATHYAEIGDVPPRALLTQPGDVALTVRDGELLSGICEEDSMLVDAGVTILRCNPEVVNPHFLAAAVLSAANRSVLIGNIAIRVDAERLRVPEVPLAQQRLMGAAYKETLHLRHRIDDAVSAQLDLERAISRAIASGSIDFGSVPIEGQ